MVSLQIYRMRGKWEVRPVLIKSAAERVFSTGVLWTTAFRAYPLKNPKMLISTRINPFPPSYRKFGHEQDLDHIVVFRTITTMHLFTEQTSPFQQILIYGQHQKK